MKSSQPKGGNKAQIWNIAEGDKHEAEGKSLFFLHVENAHETVMQRYRFVEEKRPLTSLG